MNSPSSATERDAAIRLRAELEFLAQLCGVVASTTRLEPILDWVVQKTTAMLNADEGSIKLLLPDTESTAQTIVRQHAPGIESGSWPAAITTSVMGYLLYKGGFLSTPDIRADESFPGLRNVESRIRGLLAVPLRVDNRVTGMIAVTTLAPGRSWTPQDVQLLEIVAGNSAAVIEQARLRVEAQQKAQLEREKEQLERELNLARDIQMGLVPAKPLVAGPWETHGRVVPARQVGGDYYDYFPLDDTRFGITIGDVSGKGVPASLLMSNVQASLRAYCDGKRPLASAISLVNRSVARAGSAGKFVTLFYGEIDHARSRLRYTNAGHNYPYLRRADGSVELLDKGGMILGIFDRAEYEEGEVAFGEGDRLLLYSDGLSEAENERGEMYGDDRLLELWTSSALEPTGEVIPRLFRSVEAFRGKAAQSDDMTAVVVGGRSGT